MREGGREGGGGREGRRGEFQRLLGTRAGITSFLTLQKNVSVFFLCGSPVSRVRPISCARVEIGKFLLGLRDVIH